MRFLKMLKKKGAKEPDQPSQPMFVMQNPMQGMGRVCPKCGKMNESISKFCQTCGKKFKT